MRIREVGLQLNAPFHSTLHGSILLGTMELHVWARWHEKRSVIHNNRSCLKTLVYHTRLHHRMLVAPGLADGPCRSDPTCTVPWAIGDLHLFPKCQNVACRT